MHTPRAKQAKPLKPTTPPQERGKSANPSRKTVDPNAVNEGPPQTHVVISYPGDWAPLSSAPVQHEEGGRYEYTWEGRFRKDASLEAMHELINNR